MRDFKNNHREKSPGGGGFVTGGPRSSSLIHNCECVIICVTMKVFSLPDF